LFEAISTGSSSLFLEYVAWAKVMLKGVNVPEKDLEANLKAMRDSVCALTYFDEQKTACDYLDESIEKLASMPSEVPSFLRTSEPHYDLARRYLDLLLLGDRREASLLILTAAEQLTVKEIYLNIFQPVQREVGRLWQTNRLSVAQEHFCSAATQLIMSQLYPRIFATARNGYRMVATCIGSEMHEIGIRMVADFFEMEGWDTYYIGANAPTPSIIRMLVEKKAHLLAISATMTFHIDPLRSLIDAIRADNRLDGVRIIVGGYPFNVDTMLWKKVSADGYGTDAEASERVAKTLLS
jgi:methanogenic corrinoid protein MtbC1